MNICYFTPEHAKVIHSWINSEKVFNMWSAGRFSKYPVNAEDMLKKYEFESQKGAYYSLVFVEKFNPIGHLVMRYPTRERDYLQIEFVIVDKRKRHKGNGKRIMQEAIRYASTNLGVKKLCLMVSTNNEDAIKCFESVGFKFTSLQETKSTLRGEEWVWRNMVYEVK